jgi:Cu/Ag efflux protein CusF
MYLGKPNWFPLVASILIAGLLWGCDAENQSVDESKYPKTMRGEINFVEPDARKLALKPASSEKGENSTEQGGGATQFKVAQDVMITVLGKKAQLTDLKAGQQAEVQYFVQDETETNRAGGVKVTEQPLVAKTATGRIKTIKPDSRKVILKPSSQEQGGAVVILKVAQDAAITVLGKEAQLADLKAGQQAEFRYFVKNGINKVSSVKVTEQPPVAKTATGQIKTVRPDRRKIILRQGETVMSFKVAMNATITLNGQDAELTDVKGGQQAQIQYVVQDGINRASSVKIGETAAVSGPTPG